jgi:HK97 family phage prohead protease
MKDFFLIIAGYASTFNQVDKVGDVILPGTFKKIEKPLKLLANHKNNLPLGEVLLIEEDDYGLYLEGVIFCHEAWQRSLVRKILKKEIRGLSVGILVEDAQVLDQVNYIAKAALQEVSITSQPVNGNCTIDFGEIFVVGDSGLEPPTSTMSR